MTKYKYYSWYSGDTNPKSRIQSTPKVHSSKQKRRKKQIEKKQRGICKGFRRTRRKQKICERILRRQGN